MGNAKRVPMSAIQGGQLIAKADPVVVKVMCFRYCPNSDCVRYGFFWQYKTSDQMRFCPECSTKAVNHSVDADQKQDMLKTFGAKVWNYARGDVVWNMVGVALATERPVKYSMTLVPTQIFIGKIDAGQKIAVFAKPVLADKMDATELAAAVEAQEQASALIAAIETKPQTEDGEVEKNGS